MTCVDVCEQSSATSSPPQHLKSSSSPAPPTGKQVRLLWKCWAPTGALRPTPPCGHSPHSGPGHASYTTPPGAQTDQLRQMTRKKIRGIISARTYYHCSNIRSFKAKKTVTDSVYVTVASSKASQSHDTTYQIEHSETMFNRSQGANTKQSFSLLMLWDAVPEGAAGRQPASRWCQTQWSHMTGGSCYTSSVEVKPLSYIY